MTLYAFDRAVQMSEEKLRILSVLFILLVLQTYEKEYIVDNM